MGKRLLEITPQKALAHRCFSLIDHPEQASPLFPAVHRLGQFKIAPRRRIEQHIPLLAVPLQRHKPFHPGLLGFMKIVQQPAERTGDLRLSRGASRRTGCRTELAGDQPVRQFTEICSLPEHVGAAAQAVLEKAAHFSEGKKGVVEDNLARRKAGQLIFQGGEIPQRQRGHEDLTGGNIGKGKAHLLLLDIDGGDIVVGAFVQHIRLDQRPGGDHADHLPLDQPFDELGVLHLFADGNLVALFDQPGNISVTAVIRDAAHRRPLLLPAVPAGQHQLKLAGSGNGVVKEHLIEITEAKEKNLVLMLFFDFKVLLHHGGKRRHFCSLRL